MWLGLRPGPLVTEECDSPSARLVAILMQVRYALRAWPGPQAARLAALFEPPGHASHEIVMGVPADHKGHVSC